MARNSTNVSEPIIAPIDCDAPASPAIDARSTARSSPTASAAVPRVVRGRVAVNRVRVLCRDRRPRGQRPCDAGRVKRLACILVVATACGDDASACDDCFGYLALTWQLQASDGAPRTCPPDSMVEVAMNDEIHAYPCDSLMSRRAYDGGMYQLRVTLTEGATVLATADEQSLQVPILGQMLMASVVLVVP